MLTVNSLYASHKCRRTFGLPSVEPFKPPHVGRPALIGGYVHPEEDESTSAAAARVLRGKVGLTVRLLEQLMTFSGTKRDPRG